MQAELAKVVRGRAEAEIARLTEQQRSLQHTPPGRGERPQRAEHARWQVGQVVEVYSATLGRWSVGRVARASAGDEALGTEVVVQFVSSEGAFCQKVVRPCDAAAVLAPLGAHTAEAPPGFTAAPSASRPGQLTYTDGATGLKYQLLAHAWAVHIARARGPEVEAPQPPAQASAVGGQSDRKPAGAKPLAPPVTLALAGA